MINYLKSQTERLEKEIKVANYKMEETAKNGISTELIGRIGKVTELTKELSTLIKTSWIFARKELKDIILLNKKISRRFKDKWTVDIITNPFSKELQEIISYCEAKAKEHKIELNSQKTKLRNDANVRVHSSEGRINHGKANVDKMLTRAEETIDTSADTLRGLEDGE
jgi:hypothetical protein